MPPRTSNKNLNGQSAVSTRLPTLQHPSEKQVTSLQELRPTRDFLQTHLQEPDFFWFTSNAFLKRPVLLKYWLLHPFSTRSHMQKQYHKRTTLRSERSNHKRTTLCTCPEKCKKRTLSDQPQLPRHILGASVPLGLTVAQRYDILQD